MKKLFMFVLTALSAGLSHAADLRFTAGSVYNTNQVALTVAGPTGTNLVCALERLDMGDMATTNWQNVATYTLTNGGPINLTSSLISNVYGFFRTRSTNNTYHSTNAFGAVSGLLVGTQIRILGNPLGITTLTNIFTAPTDGLTVNKWDNSTGNYITSTYFGGWDTNLTIGELEGFFVDNYDTNSVRYLFSGLFTTNTVTKTLPENLSIITSPGYYLTYNSTLLENDLLDRTKLGGLFNIPVQSSGYVPQCDLYQYIWIAPPNFYSAYLHCALVTDHWGIVPGGGNDYQVRLHLGEGFWINKPTNAVWTVNRPIW